MWTWFFTNEHVIDFARAATSDTARFGGFHRAMLDAGVWLPPSQFEAIFLGTSHTAEVIDATIDAARHAVASLQEAQAAR
jgi:glutamate-1-semialdehyde 2,1-aminomutase